jgi:serine/threonine protein kinase
MAAKEPVNNEISCMRSPEHKNIMARYGVHETENLEYLIVEYMGGRTLQNYIQSQLHLTGKEIFRVIKEILSGLDYLNFKDIMHRNLIP